MFTIQYAAVDGTSRMQNIGGNDRNKLVRHLSSFERPILAVYEQATPITKAVRDLLQAYPPSKLSRCAKDFVLKASCPA